MAKTKDIPEVYLCEIDADRESIVPYAGQKCIMQNGDIYVCVRNGVWGKIGVEPSTYTVTFKINNDTYKEMVCVQGTSIDAPEPPEQIGATFDGWKDGDNNFVSFPYTPVADTILTAVFTPITPPTPTGYNIKAINAIFAVPDQDTYVGVNDEALNLTSTDVWATTTPVPVEGVFTNIVFTTGTDEAFATHNYCLTWSIREGGPNLYIVDKCKFNPDTQEFEENENAFTWIIIGLGDSFDFSIYKTTAPVRAHQIEIPADVEFTADSFAFGNVSNGYPLGLNAGTRYRMTLTIGEITANATPFATNLGDGIISLEGGASLGYVNLYDNAYYDYEDLNNDGTPKMKARNNSYCFRAPEDVISATGYVDVASYIE